jgi:hypothetical protein
MRCINAEKKKKMRRNKRNWLEKLRKGNDLGIGMGLEKEGMVK